MSENSGLKVLVISSALFVAGALGGAGYAGFMKLQDQLAQLQEQTTRVVVDLNAELIGEIEKAQWKPAGEAVDNGADSREIRDTLAQLRTAIDTLAERQAAINETLGKEEPPTPLEGEKRTIYFEMAKADGEAADKQISSALIELSKYADRPDCSASVNGYADTLGRDAANLALSRERARYVAAYVREYGIKVAGVQAWGERRLKTHTFDGIDHKNNRRVEIDIACDGPVAEDTTPIS